MTSATIVTAAGGTILAIGVGFVFLPAGLITLGILMICMGLFLLPAGDS